MHYCIKTFNPGPVSSSYTSNSKKKCIHYRTITWIFLLFFPPSDLFLNVKLNWEQYSPLTTPTPTLLRLVFMDNTWNHSSVLALYASIVDRPANAHRTCIRNATNNHISYHFLLLLKLKAVSWPHRSHEFQKHFINTPAQLYLCCRQSPPQRTGVH